MKVKTLEKNKKTSKKILENLPKEEKQEIILFIFR